MSLTNVKLAETPSPQAEGIFVPAHLLSKVGVYLGHPDVRDADQLVDAVRGFVERQHRPVRGDDSESKQGRSGGSRSRRSRRRSVRDHIRGTQIRLLFYKVLLVLVLSGVGMALVITLGNQSLAPR